MKKYIVFLAIFLAACSAQLEPTVAETESATPASMSDVESAASTANSEQEGMHFENGNIVIPQTDGSEKSVTVYPSPSEHIGESALVFNIDNSPEVVSIDSKTIPNGSQVVIISVSDTTVQVGYNTDTFTLSSNAIVFIPTQ